MFKRLPGRMGASLWRRRWRQSRLPMPGVMTAYQRWQQQFFHQRLGLLIGLFLLVLVSFTLIEIIRFLGTLETITNGAFQQTVDVFWGNALIGGVLLLGLGLRKTRWGRQYAGVIFLGISATVTLTPVWAAIFHTNSLDNGEIALWTLVFLSQATLVPVRWQLHLRSQIILFIPLLLLITLAAVFGDLGSNRYELITNVLFLGVYLLWVCFVADLAVYLYERLRYREFEARQTIQTFLHAVSHDLRNPVTGMQLFLKSLLEQAEQTGTNRLTLSRSVVEQMIQGGDRQLCLINSLLEAHGNTLHAIELQRQAIPLHPLIDDLHQELSPLLQNAQATLINQVNSNLPAIYGDRTQLWRVFQNLIGNAIQHNPPEITIHIQAVVITSANPYIYCTVSDNGVGMNPEECEHLFELYAQGNHRRRHLNIGLGLHIARQIVVAHGGNLGVESQPNQGCQFWLTLPIA